MNKLFLAAFVCLCAPALHAQSYTPARAAIALPGQDKSTPPQPAELQEADKPGASVAQLYAARNYKEALSLPGAVRGSPRFQSRASQSVERHSSYLTSPSGKQRGVRA